MNFPGEFGSAVKRADLDFGIRGVLTCDDRVLQLGTDTKVLSTVFELFCRPLIAEIAKDHDLVVEEAPQTIYPDFTLLRNKSDKSKIAVDIKTTYRRPGIGFTLGSYTSFLRNNTKNILYPYSEYDGHWIIGFVYTRSDHIDDRILTLDEREFAYQPYVKVDWFVQEKYRIAGVSPGSGNTTNIGSIKSRSISDFKRGDGPFARHGEKVFRDYWANFEPKAKNRQYRNVDEFLDWQRATRR